MAHLRDTIVIGASAGGVKALRGLCGQLASDLPATLLVTLHQASHGETRLVQVLQAATRLEVQWARDGEAVRRGVIHVAPPDRHLVLQDGRTRVVLGPRENRARPAINPLFRSAAADRAGRVVALLLSGLLDDGVTGLAAVQRCGGVTIVQDPQDAEFPELPRRAVEEGAADHVLALPRMSELLERLLREEAPRVAVPEEIAVEARLDGPTPSSSEAVSALGKQVPVGCPECGGPLWQTSASGNSAFRCHTGHAFTARALLDGQSEEIERSMWVAVRALLEQSSVLERLARDAERRGAGLGTRFRQRAEEARAHADQARRFLVSLRSEL